MNNGPTSPPLRKAGFQALSGVGLAVLEDLQSSKSWSPLRKSSILFRRALLS